MSEYLWITLFLLSTFLFFITPCPSQVAQIFKKLKGERGRERWPHLSEIGAIFPFPLYNSPSLYFNCLFYSLSFCTLFLNNVQFLNKMVNFIKKEKTTYWYTNKSHALWYTVIVRGCGWRCISNIFQHWTKFSKETSQN